MKTHNKESGVEKQVQEIIDSGEDVAVGILSLENWKEEIKQALQKAFTAGLMQEAEHTENYIKDAREDERHKIKEEILKIKVSCLQTRSVILQNL